MPDAALLCDAFGHVSDANPPASALLGGRDEIAGDFYDVFPVDGTHWGIVLGDVAGREPRPAPSQA